jgi:hypothetical protein
MQKEAKFFTLALLSVAVVADATLFRQLASHRGYTNNPVVTDNMAPRHGDEA